MATRDNSSRGRKAASKRQKPSKIELRWTDPLGPDARAAGPEKPRPDDPGEYAIMQAFQKNRPFVDLIAARSKAADRPHRVAGVIDPGPVAVAKHHKSVGAYLPGGAKPKVTIAGAKNPAADSSFGFVGKTVSVKSDGLVDGVLALPFATDKLDDIARQSLRLFRFDPQEKRFRIVRGSVPSAYGDYVFGRIATTGHYSIIGLRTEPASLQTFRVAAALGPVGRMFGDMPELRERLCLLILCAPELQARFDDPHVMEQMMWAHAMDGLPYPSERMPPPNRRGDGFRGDICDFCLGQSGTRIPEIDILEEFPPFGTTPGCNEGPWETAGPVDLAGCVKHVHVDPTDSNRIYCAAAHGGVWRLDDVSRYPYVTWTPITDQEPLLKTVAIAVAPSAPDILYYGDAAGRVHRSIDRGANWTLPSTLRHHTSPTLWNPLRILVHPSTPDVLIVSGNAGLRVSVDGGVSWLLRTTRAVEAVSMDPQDSSILYVAIRGEGVYKSYAMGADETTWTLLLPWGEADAPVNSTIRLGLGYRNADGSLQTDADRTVVAKLGNEVFVNQAGGRNTGVGWQSKGKVGSHGYGDWCNAVAVDPFDPDVILAGQMELFRTSDGGDSWTTVATYYGPHEDQQFIEFDRNTRDTVYLANDGGVYRSTDGGVTWFVPGETVADGIAVGRDLNKDLVTAEFYRVGVQGHRAVGNLFHSGIIASNDLRTDRWRGIEGHAWEFNFVFADPKRLRRFYVFTNTNLAIRRYPGVGGADNFVPFSPVDTDTAPPYQTGGGTSLAVGAIAVDERPGSGIILYGALPGTDSTDHRLMKTDDGDLYPEKQPDDSWANMPAWRSVIDNGGDPIVAVSFEPHLKRRAYAMSRDGHLFINDDVDIDAGWAEADRWAVSGVRHMAVADGEDPVVYAVTGTQIGRRRPGQAWNTVGAATKPASEINSIVACPGDPLRVFVGADEGVFQSLDEGDTWSPFDADLPNAEVLQIFTHNGYLWAVTHGRGLWQYKLC